MATGWKHICTNRWDKKEIAVMFEKNDAQIAELRFHILHSMMDDAEDIEQVYLSANRDELFSKSRGSRDSLCVKS